MNIQNNQTCFAISSFRKIMMTLSRRYDDTLSTGITAQVTLSVTPTGISLNNLNSSIWFSITAVLWFLQSFCKHSKS